MPAFRASGEQCPDTRLLVGYVPGFPGAHSQGASRYELHQNRHKVILMLLEDYVDSGALTIELEA